MLWLMSHLSCPQAIPRLRHQLLLTSLRADSSPFTHLLYLPPLGWPIYTQTLSLPPCEARLWSYDITEFSVLLTFWFIWLILACFSCFLFLLFYLCLSLIPVCPTDLVCPILPLTPHGYSSWLLLNIEPLHLHLTRVSACYTISFLLTFLFPSFRYKLVLAS